MKQTSMEQWQYTAIAWTALGVVVVGVYFISTLSQKRSTNALRTSPQQIPVEKEIRSTVGLKAAKSTPPANDAGRNLKKKKKTGLTPATSVNVPKSSPLPVDELKDAAQHYNINESGDSDNLEWARRAAMVRSGVSLKSDAVSSKSQGRTLKQSVVNGSNASIPEIADMLPVSQAAPLSLRVTPSTQPEKSVRQQKDSSPTTESKKQRQNRKKAEEKRQATILAADEQKGLMEQQRRRAREARGEPAKDGSRFLAEINGNSNSNSWTAPLSHPESTSAAEQLLDTFDSNVSTSESVENDDGWLQVGSKKARKDRDDSTSAPLSKDSTTTKTTTVSPPSYSGVGYTPPVVSAGVRHHLDSTWSVE